MASPRCCREPGAEPAPATGARLLLRTAAEACLPALRAQLEAQDLLPQQALGALSFTCEVLNRLLVHLSEPEGLAKYRRLKLSALRRRLPRPERAEAVLAAAGFEVVGEHLEWGPETPEVLARSLAVQVLVARLQEAGQSSFRCLVDRLNSEIEDFEVILLNYGCQLLEAEVSPAKGGYNPLGAGATNTAGGVEGALVTRRWLGSNLPGFAAAFEGKDSASPRERALARALGRALPLRPAPKLEALAHWAARGELLALRAPELRSELEPELEPELEAPSGGAQVAKALWRCVPAARLGYAVQTLHTVIRLSEAPAFFTLGYKEKPFEVSIQSLTQRIASEWLPQLSGTCIGIACVTDIDHDDKAVIFAVVA